jgi:hypothetical protein
MVMILLIHLELNQLYLKNGIEYFIVNLKMMMTDNVNFVIFIYNNIRRERTILIDIEIYLIQFEISYS